MPGYPTEHAPTAQWLGTPNASPSLYFLTLRTPNTAEERAVRSCSYVATGNGWLSGEVSTGGFERGRYCTAEISKIKNVVRIVILVLRRWNVGIAWVYQWLSWYYHSALGIILR